METTIKTHQATGTLRQQAGTRSHSQTAKRETAYDRWINKISFNYFGIISMTILMGSIIGGISAMYILKNDAPIWQLGLCMATASANNVMAIGQAPTKWMINSFFINVGVNILLILVNVL